MDFTSYGFDVYTSEVDDHGIDFVAKGKNGIFYEVQVKSVRNDNYVFIRKSKIVLDDKHLVCFIRFNDGELPDCYVFPATVWMNPDGSLFTSKDYESLKSAPEYPHHVIYSANNLFPEMALQMEKYFQIIAAYVSGLTNKLNISETDLKNDRRLQILFSTSVHEITKKKRELDRMGLIKLAEDAGKPVLVRV